MSDTAQNPHTDINDIWSLPDPAVNLPDPQNQQPLQNRPSGGFGKPGLAGGGESGVGLESGAATEVQPSTESFKAPEILISPEEGEKLQSAEVYKPKEEQVKEMPAAQPDTTSTQGKIVDQRTRKVKTHRVAEIADRTTKVADVKEQEFIEGVEQVHSII